jgi:hypothetical protein
MAETTRLSVGEVLDKLRSNTDAPKPKVKQLDEKMQALDEEIQRMKTIRRRLERDQQSASK